MINLAKKDIEQFTDKEKAKILVKYFKNNYCLKNEIFLGITVPKIRKLVKKYYNKLDFEALDFFINSNIHEYRFFALQILVEKYKKTQNKEQIVNYYLSNLKNINNWDLVDTSCYKILGDYIYNYTKKCTILNKLSKSKILWEKRISIVSTMYFIKNNYFEPSLKICKYLLSDNEDLIQKAIGWILREIGKKNIEILDNFLIKNIHKIKNISLNYAMEKFTNEKKKHYRKLKKQWRLRHESNVRPTA